MQVQDDVNEDRAPNPFDVCGKAEVAFADAYVREEPDAVGRPLMGLVGARPMIVIEAPFNRGGTAARVPSAVMLGAPEIFGAPHQRCVKNVQKRHGTCRFNDRPHPSASEAQALRLRLWRGAAYAPRQVAKMEVWRPARSAET